MSARLLTAVVIAGVLVTGWSCGNPSGQGNGCASTGAKVTINAQDNQTFDKPAVTVTKGDRVCWQNFGTKAHTVTATSASPADTNWTTAAFDRQLNPDQVVIANFGNVGNYFYHCVLHPGMTGEVDVR